MGPRKRQEMEIVLSTLQRKFQDGDGNVVSTWDGRAGSKAGPVSPTAAGQFLNHVKRRIKEYPLAVVALLHVFGTAESGGFVQRKFQDRCPNKAKESSRLPFGAS